MSGWRMPTACVDCPFNATGPGRRLRDALRPGRYRSILAGLRRGEHFLCHKTTRETGDGSNKVCAGALAYQERLGVSSQYVRMCERLEGFARERTAATR